MQSSVQHTGWLGLGYSWGWGVVAKIYSETNIPHCTKLQSLSWTSVMEMLMMTKSLLKSSCLVDMLPSFLVYNKPLKTWQFSIWHHRVTVKKEKFVSFDSTLIMLTLFNNIIFPNLKIKEESKLFPCLLLISKTSDY